MIDKKARIVFPKPIGEKMRVEAGDDLLIEAESNRIILRLVVRR